MKKKTWLIPSLSSAALLASWPGLAQTSASDSSPGLALEPAQPSWPDRFGLSYRMGFNLTVSFHNLGGFAAQGHSVPNNGFQPANPGPASGFGFNRTYEDGYNWTDQNGNVPPYQGLTWFWGYDSRQQLQEQPGFLVMHSSSSPATASSKDLDSDPVSGFELSYQRELARGKHWRCGVEAAFGYAPLSVNDSRPVYADVNRVSDAFALTVPASEILDPASRQGSFFGPRDTPPRDGTLLSDDPQRSTSVIANGVSITGQRDFSADLYGFRLGPYLELSLSRRVALTLSGGLALAYINSDFSFSETVSIAGLTPETHAGSGSHSDLLPGGYVAGNCLVTLSDRWTAFAGAQFQSLGEYTHTESGKQATLDLRQALFVTLGVTYSF